MEPTSTNTPAQHVALTLEAIYDEKIFETKTLRQPHWMQDSKRISYLDCAPDSETLTLWTIHIETGEKRCVIPREALRLPEVELARRGPSASETETPEAQPRYIEIPGYLWSPDETSVLLATRPERRASRPGDRALYLFDIGAGEMTRLNEDDELRRNVKFSPDGRLIGYVKNDDLYLADKNMEREVRLTDTATKTRYNGRFGWVYTEELHLTDGWDWSPDGKRIAYFQIDEEDVPIVPLTDYDDLHLKPIEMRYPKAGDPNPKVKIGVIDLPALPPVAQLPIPPTRWIDLGPETDILITRMQWTPKGDLLLQRQPRLQNRIELLKVNPATGAIKVILTEEDSAWVDAPGDLKFVPNADQFLWPSDRSGFRQLYLYDLEGKLIRPLTQGEQDVDEVVGIDGTHRQAFFTACAPTPRERQLFSVLLDGGSQQTRLTEAPGTHRVLFAPDCAHFLDTHSARETPPSVRVCRASGKPLFLLIENAMPKLAGRVLAKWESIAFKTSDGVELQAVLMKPPHFDPKKKYPVILHTYGGPGSQITKDAFESGGGLERYLAEKGFVFAAVDGRGTGGRGRDFMKKVYLQLGQWEVHDQIEAAQWLAKQPFVDSKHIGIWGWSYGGYMASLCILRGAEVFRAAVAVAPVTHWELYDTIYTERYMRRPHDNPKGYRETTPLREIGKLKGHFLLVHGLADDNVHFQNSARLAAELQKQEKPFRAMFYPGKGHGLEGMSKHLFTMISDFFLTTLKPAG